MKKRTYAGTGANDDAVLRPRDPGPVIEHGYLADATLVRARIRDSILSSVRIEGSTIAGGKLLNCYIDETTNWPEREKLEAENQRLREALELIARLEPETGTTIIARNALAQEDKGS